MNKKEIGDAAIALRKEKERVRIAAYLEANPEKVRATKAKYRAANLEKIKEAAAKYRVANPEKINAYQRANRAAKKTLEAIPAGVKAK